MGKIIVYYQQHWLPDFEGLESNNFFNINSFREIEVVLEPQILAICLLRKLYSLKISLKPCLYDSFCDGILPATLASNPAKSDASSTLNTYNLDKNTGYLQSFNRNTDGTGAGISNTPGHAALDNTNTVNLGSFYNYAFFYGDGLVLRNEELIRHLVRMANLRIKLNSTQLLTDFSQHYPVPSNDGEANGDSASSIPDPNDSTDDQNPSNSTNGHSVSANDPNSSPNDAATDSNLPSARYNRILLLSYIHSHLRHCVLYLIWLHPAVSQFTFSVFVNSEPVPFAYYSFLRKRMQIRHECHQFGYSSLDKVLRDLRFILEGVRTAISQKYHEKYTLNDICWFEGYVFSNLSVLFSLPCQDLDELMFIHDEFNDLKVYCININSRYDVVSLKPPFLSGDSMATTDFKNTFIWNLLNIL